MTYEQDKQDLIAANAPLLLEACEEATEWLKTNEGDAERLLYKLESAIKKARKEN